MKCQTHSGASRPRAPALVAVRSWRWEFVLRTRRSGAWVFHQCMQQFNLSRREKHRLALITAQFRQVPGWHWKWTSAHSNTRLACDGSSINKGTGFAATLLQCVMCAANPLWAAVTIKLLLWQFCGSSQFILLNHISVTVWCETKSNWVQSWPLVANTYFCLLSISDVQIFTFHPKKKVDTVQN